MQQADIIISGGRIFSGLAEGFVDALAIGADRVLAAGPADDVMSLRGDGTRLIDLDGRVAIPGLNDAHMHLLLLGLGMKEVNLRAEEGVRSIDELLRRIADDAKAKKPGQWVVGAGYDHNELAERRHPTADELDRIAPDNPIYIKRTCGHIAVVNTQAMRAAGIGHNTPNPEGGLIERRDNRLTGLLAESAMRLVVAALPKPSKAELVTAIEHAGQYMLSQGFTSVMDAAVGMAAGMDEIEAYEEAARSNRLPVRTWVCIYGNPDGIADVAHAAGHRFGREVGRLRYGAMKVFADGSAGGLTAAMSEPYIAGEPDNRGLFCFSEEEMHRLLARYHDLGYQLAIHAIGDAAIEQVLSGMEKAASAETPIQGRRHRIEHCGFLSDDQLARMAAAGIDPVPQPIFIYEFGDLYIHNLGQDRAGASYPMRRWLDAGLHPAASSDAPVSATDPFKNLFTMVTRKSKRGTVIGERERLTMEEAVHAYTYCGAFTQFAEGQVGRLVPGQAADIAILSHDIFAVEPEVVETQARCDMTILGGEIVFDRLGQFANAAA
ncbi:amidohydrolase [Microvirga sp. 0TCS3.31]